MCAIDVSLMLAIKVKKASSLTWKKTKW
jgi:hypothetical protein